MNQKQIGKFISEERKNKNLTQSELAEKLGVTDRSISNWENGKCLPDLSLFKPLCEILDITINELMSGEKIPKEKYQNKLEENIVNTINYGNKQALSKEIKLGIYILIFGIIIIITALSIFPSESSWSSIYSVIGTITTTIGFYKIIANIKKTNRIILSTILFIVLLALELTLDYVNVLRNNLPPRFAYHIEYIYNLTYYKTPFYNVFKMNANTEFEYYIIDTKKEYTPETINKFPFNYKRSGIENIIKYESLYLGNNSNTGNLILNLPLAEYGYDFEINTDLLELTINYRISTNYLEKYLKEAVIYSSVSLFSLIKNLEQITYNFSGSSITITRKQIESNYENFTEIFKNNKVNKEKFKTLVENKISNKEFINETYNKIFNE